MEKTKEISESGPIKFVADATVVIVIEKLRKLRLTEEVSLCLALKGQVDDVIPKLEGVYEFLKDKCWRESHYEWTDRLLRAIYNAEDKIDIFMCQIVRQEQQTIRIAPDVLMTIWWKCLFHGEMKSFIREVDELLQDQHLNVRNTNKSGHLIKQPENQKQTIPESQYYQRWQKVNAEGEDPANIGSYRNKTYGDVIKRLLKEKPAELCGRAIYGDEGSGKTYLAGRVFHDSRIRNHFERRAWVHVTNSLTLKDIRYEVLKQVKAHDRVLMNREHMDEEGVKQALLKELSDKRYLVVLDDFCNDDTWYELISYLPDWSKGSCILVTTRSEYIAYVTDYGHPIKLENLGSQDSKLLLQKKVKPEMPNLQDEDIHVNIFRASNGLPLAISLLGGLLLGSIREGQPLQIEKVSLPDILTLSYNNLPREEKPCFLYLTLFPKATPIPVRRILRLWLGEGLLTGSDKNSHEDLGVKYLEDLIMRNLVEVVSWKPDGTPWTCQVVTSMYDKFYTQAEDVGLLRIHNQKERDINPSHTEPVEFKGPQFKVRWLAEHSNVKSFFQSNSYLIKHMRSFISFYTRKGILTKDLGTFLRTVTSHNSFRLLRVLDLEGVYKPYLHETIGRLVLLKYLGLRSTVLDTLPDRVGCLPELETLDIKNTNITNLADSLWKSGCLRHLYLNGFHVDPKILRRSSRFLTNLRTLSGLYVGNISESLVSGLVASVTNLTKLKIYYQSTDKVESITQWISKLTNLHSLKLGIIEKDRQPAQLPNLTYLPEHHHLFNLYLLGKLSKLDANQLPPCLRVLTLSKSELAIDPMHNLGQLQHLRTLRLLANSYTGNKMRCSTKGFPSLRVLKIWSLTKLEELTVETDCMRNLKELEIRDCVMLKFERDIGLKHLTSLEELLLTKMPEVSVTDARKKMVELPKDCCFYETGTMEQEQTKEGKGEVLQKGEKKEGKIDNETTGLQQGSRQPKEKKEEEGLREEHTVAAKMKQETANRSEDLPQSQSPNKISHTEEKPAPSLTPTSQMDENHKGPSFVVPAATRTGQGGANPFAF